MLQRIYVPEMRPKSCNRQLGLMPMTTTRLAAENRRRLICKLLAEHPYLTHAAIAQTVGCWRAYVTKVAGQMRREGKCRV